MMGVQLTTVQERHAYVGISFIHELELDTGVLAPEDRVLLDFGSHEFAATNEPDGHRLSVLPFLIIRQSLRMNSVS